MPLLLASQLLLAPPSRLFIVSFRAVASILAVADMLMLSSPHVAGIHVMSFHLLLAPVLLLVFLPSCCLPSPQAVSRPCGKLHNGKQHGAASSPSLQVDPAPPDQFPMGRLPAQPQAVCRPC
jgi:hypothetical protein